MPTIIRLAIGAGLFAFGYFLGKQVGMLEPIRSDLARARKEREEEDGGTGEPEGGEGRGPGD